MALPALPTEGIPEGDIDPHVSQSVNQCRHHGLFDCNKVATKLKMKAEDVFFIHVMTCKCEEAQLILLNMEVGMSILRDSQKRRAAFMVISS